MTCPQCGSTNIKTTEVIHTFEVAIPSAVLMARVPMRICRDCDFRYYDDEAADKKDKVLKQYLRCINESK